MVATREAGGALSDALPGPARARLSPGVLRSRGTAGIRLSALVPGRETGAHRSVVMLACSGFQRARAGAQV